MTPEEFNYIKRAVEALASGEHSQMAQHKILRTMSQICGRAADAIETEFVSAVDKNLAHQHLVETLRGGAQ